MYRHGCGNNVHIKCMKVWADHQMQTAKSPNVTCPICRNDFGTYTHLCREYQNIMGDQRQLKRQAISNHIGVECNVCDMLPIKVRILLLIRFLFHFLSYALPCSIRILLEKKSYTEMYTLKYFIKYAWNYSSCKAQYANPNCTWVIKCVNRFATFHTKYFIRHSWYTEFPQSWCTFSKILNLG